MTLTIGASPRPAQGLVASACPGSSITGKILARSSARRFSCSPYLAEIAARPASSASAGTAIFPRPAEPVTASGHELPSQ